MRRLYRVKRCHQLSQAHNADTDYRIGKYLVPETVKFEWNDNANQAQSETCFSCAEVPTAEPEG